VPRDAFRFTAGDASLKSWSFTQNDTGLVFETAFCGDCGTLIYKKNDDDAFKAVYILQAATTEEGIGAGGAPGVEFWVGYRPEWVPAAVGAKQAKGFA
jgi:hypothetical protein